jgi:hypothetical protein
MCFYLPSSLIQNKNLLFSLYTGTSGGFTSPQFPGQYSECRHLWLSSTRNLLNLMYLMKIARDSSRWGIFLELWAALIARTLKLRTLAVQPEKCFGTGKDFSLSMFR